MKHIEKVIKTKRKYNHTTAKKVTTSAEMNAGTVLKSNKNNLSFEEAKAREQINYTKKFGMDRRNW